MLARIRCCHRISSPRLAGWPWIAVFFCFYLLCCSTSCVSAFDASDGQVSELCGMVVQIMADCATVRNLEEVRSGRLERSRRVVTSAHERVATRAMSSDTMLNDYIN